MTGIDVTLADGTSVGRVQPVVIDGTTRWRSWRPDDLKPPNSGPIGVHQDQAQAEAYLRQLASMATPKPTTEGAPHAHTRGRRPGGRNLA